MNLVELGAVGELVGGFAVIGSLIYVGVQIRHNTRATRRSSARDGMADHSAVLRALMADEALAEIMIRGQLDIESLNPVERYRLDLALISWLYPLEQAFAAHRDGFYPAEFVLPVRPSIKTILSSPGGSRWWAERRSWLSDYFQAEVDQILRDDSIEGGRSGVLPNTPSV